jgi:glycosyltransferase involved in cell wall biosynthesis
MEPKTKIQLAKDKIKQPTVSIITRCKGRRAALTRTIPFMLAQSYPYTEVIVVNYDCPDDLHLWLTTTHKKVIEIGKLVEVLVPNKPYFHHSHSRNVGLKAAIGDWVFFIDADCQPNTRLIVHIFDRIKGMKNVFASIGSPPRGRAGTLFAKREDLLEIGGYNEELEGWGYEDGDIKDRLFKAGKEMYSFLPKYIGEIQHGDSERWEYMAPPYNRTNKPPNWKGIERGHNFAKSQNSIREHGSMANKGKEWGVGGQILAKKRWIHDIWHDDNLLDTSKALHPDIKGAYAVLFDKHGNCTNEKELLKMGMPKGYLEAAKNKRLHDKKHLVKLSKDRPITQRDIIIKPEDIERPPDEQDTIVEIEEDRT